jgi:hypothetical protein
MEEIVVSGSGERLLIVPAFKRPSEAPADVEWFYENLHVRTRTQVAAKLLRRQAGLIALIRNLVIFVFWCLR